MDVYQPLPVGSWDRSNRLWRASYFFLFHLPLRKAQQNIFGWLIPELPRTAVTVTEGRWLRSADQTRTGWQRVGRSPPGRAQALSEPSCWGGGHSAALVHDTAALTSSGSLQGADPDQKRASTSPALHSFQSNSMENDQERTSRSKL